MRELLKKFILFNRRKTLLRKNNLVNKTDDAKENAPIIYTVSDGTGETARGVIRAVLAQFDDVDVKTERFNQVRTRELLDEILKNALQHQATVVATIVNPDLRVFLISRAMQLGVRVVDVLFPVLELLSRQFGKRPSEIPNRLRQLDTDYFKRIWAVEYTVRHDDGMSLHDLNEAEIILTGVSRTSKTPLSMYLSNRGYRVANIPLVLNTEPPAALFEVDQRKIFALTIDVNRLAEIRTARVKALGAVAYGGYADEKQIFEELEWARKLFSKNKIWPLIDVTGRAVEENAVEIEEVFLSRFPELAKI